MIVTALFGNPVDHSISPHLFNYYAGLFNLEYSHIKTNIEKEELGKAIDSIRILGLAGVNITLPYKQETIQYLDIVSDEVQQIGAVNTIKNDNGKLIGYNTDWYGAVKAIEIKLKREINKNDRVVIFGTGGAARALIYGINKFTDSITVFYRNPQSLRTKTLRKDFGKKINFQPYSTNIKQYLMDSTIICNATSVGMTPNINKSPIKLDGLNLKNKICLDAIFNPKKTLFLENAEKQGAVIQSGIDWMIYQGIRAFKLWSGKEVDEKVVPIIRKKLNKILS